LPRSYKDLALNPRYVNELQARTSMVTWKLFGRRMDGHADDAPFYSSGKAPAKPFRPTRMPPPEAVAGTYEGPDGKKIKVASLTDEDRLTLIRWMDLGCSIDLRFDPGRTDPATSPFTDRTLPTLTVTHPSGGGNSDPLTRIVIGMADAASGIDQSSFTVTADFAIDGAEPGREMATHFRETSPGVWEMRLKEPIRSLKQGKLAVQVADRERNVTRIERSFSVASE
jgi:hypothetical protein